MGIFKGLFGSKEGQPKMEKKEVPWIPLTSVEQLEEIAKKSERRTQLIFKHSTSCGISRMVLNSFVNAHDFNEGPLDLYYLDLHRFRAVSNETANKFGILHQSPQLLVIKDGVLKAHASHGGIADMVLQDMI